jgi:hypothetical protein
MTEAPVRLRDDPGVSAELRCDIERALHDVPVFDVSAGVTRLEATLQAGPPPDPSSGVSQSGAGLGSHGVLGALKQVPWAIKVGLAALGVSAGGLWLAAEPSVESRAVGPSSAAPESAHAAHGEEVRAVDPAPTQEPAPEPATSVTQREIAHLVRIKALLERNPKAAYRFAQASLRELPEGTLREERAGLYVMAAFRASDVRHARAQMEVFLARYPQSPLRERLLNLAAEAAQDH